LSLSSNIGDLSLARFFRLLHDRGRGVEADAIKERVVTALAEAVTEQALFDMRFNDVITLLTVSTLLTLPPPNPIEQRIRDLEMEGFHVYVNPEVVSQYGRYHDTRNP
jgi:hypothetical protein